MFWFYPMFLDFSKMPGDIGDMRLVAYILEHGFLFFKGEHSSFWNMPIFYPNTNTLAYSDVFLGGMFLYAPFRLFLDMWGSIQALVLIVLFLNYISFFLFSSKVLKFNVLISSILAFFFTFALPRYVQTSHIQLFIQFFSIFSLYFFLSANKRISHFIISSLFLVLQFYTSFYFGYLSVFVAAIAVLVMLIKKDTRDILIKFIIDNKMQLFIFASVFTVLIFPLFYHYLNTGKMGFGYHTNGLFMKTSFLASRSFIDNLIFHTDSLVMPSAEVITGIGIFTTIFVFIGLFKLKKYRLQVFIFLVLIISLFWVHFLYRFMYKYIIGMQAIRTGARVVFLLLPVFCFLIGNFFKNIKNKTVFAICLILFVIEQLPISFAFNTNKNELNKRLEAYQELDESCGTFYAEVDENWHFMKRDAVNLDAMMLSLKYKKPTINGYSGYAPPLNKSFINTKCTIRLK